MISKIKKSILEGTFFLNLKRKLHSFVPIYYINNRNIVFQQEIDFHYRKLKKEFGAVELETMETLPESNVRTDESNKIWICWFQGEEQAPEIVRTCIQSIRRYYPDKEIIVLDDNNLSNYVVLPDYIIRKRKLGRISNAHYSDLIRIDLLCNYGGIWLDATVLATSTFLELDKFPLFVYKQLDLTRQEQYQPIVASSWIISAQKGQRILLLTRKFLWKYWEKKDFLEHYFLFHIFFSIATERYQEDWANVPLYNNHNPHVLFFELEQTYSEERWAAIQLQSCFHKLNHHKTYDTLTNTFYQYIVTSMKE